MYKIECMGCHRGRMGCRGAINYRFSFRSFPVTSSRAWQIGVMPSARHTEPPLLPYLTFRAHKHARIRKRPRLADRPAVGSRLRWRPGFVSDAFSSLGAHTCFQSYNCRALDVLTLDTSHQRRVHDFWQRTEHSPAMASDAWYHQLKCARAC